MTVFREVSSRRQAKWTFLSRSASSASRHYDDPILNQPGADYGGVIYTYCEGMVDAHPTSPVPSRDAGIIHQDNLTAESAGPSA